MHNTHEFLEKKGYIYDSEFRKEKEAAVSDVRDFFLGESRVTVVKLVDKYQVMVYDGKMIHSSDHSSEHLIIQYLKGIL